MPSPLTIWCNADLPTQVIGDLIAATGKQRLLLEKDRSANISAGGPSAALEEADVAFGQPDPDQLLALTRLKWVHITSAGYTRYDRDDLKQAFQSRGIAFTNSSSVFDEPCAQHLLAFMLAQARQLPQSMIDQLGAKTWVYASLRPQTRLLRDQTVLILSYGAIARRLIELLQPFRLKVLAVRREVKGDEAVPTFPISDLHRLLPQADHIVNILPASPSTNELIAEPEFASAKPGAIFYNIGRGTTVNQAALIKTLESKRLGAAYLDVVDPEPLPFTDPLWSAPNCWITPHIGGGHAEEYPRLLEHFLENLKRFEAGQPLRDRVF